MTQLEVGATRTETNIVADEDVVTFMGPDRRVLASPRMIMFMERVCRKMVGEVLPEGLATVGMHVNIWHRAAAPEGSAVVYTAVLISVMPKRYEFRVEARMGDKLIGEGTHLRGVVDLSRFAKPGFTTPR
jgi:fluoroacetyl-CoA thioesterase